MSSVHTETSEFDNSTSNKLLKIATLKSNLYSQKQLNIENKQLIMQAMIHVHKRLLVQGSMKETTMYRVPSVTVSPSCQWVSLPGCMNVHPAFVSTTLQL